MINDPLGRKDEKMLGEFRTEINRIGKRMEALDSQYKHTNI